MRRAERLFRIVGLFRDRKVLTAAELSEALEVCERTIYRDIAHLQASGVGIEGVGGIGLDPRRPFGVLLGGQGENRQEEQGLLRDIEVPLALLLGRMEETGVQLDVAHLKALANKVGVEVTRLEKEAHDLVGKTFNINAPRQLEVILFDDLKLPVLKRTKTARSTDAEVLEELAQQNPLPAKILEVRSLTKLQGTYLEALPALIDKNGRIHTSYGQAVAATGRISSSNPNLQNIPIRTPLGREIRNLRVRAVGLQRMGVCARGEANIAIVRIGKCIRSHGVTEDISLGCFLIWERNG